MGRPHPLSNVISQLTMLLVSLHKYESASAYQYGIMIGITHKCRLFGHYMCTCMYIMLAVGLACVRVRTRVCLDSDVKGRQGEDQCVLQHSNK